MKTQIELHGLTQAMHVSPCHVVKLRETSMLEIISTKRDKITESKLKLLYIKRALKEKNIFSRLAFVYVLSGWLKSRK